ncbi:hypothetical protein [Roseivirga sp.]|uniref:hypothetical protein n=1 Tax=Roseivirga sp. TaxID=1964215 RepID=UPI003B5304AF
MKKILSVAFVAMGVIFISTSAKATKWKDSFTEVVAGCEITHQYCDRRFLSFDGCEYGETRAVFDATSSSCVNMLLMAER